jgi:poly(A) polymerase
MGLEALKNHPFLMAVARRFEEGTVFIVGGSVRDALLGREVSDFDFAVKRGKEVEVGRFLKELTGWTMFPLSDKHGTIRLSDGERVIDITPFDELSEDLRRRDFTVNSMAVETTSLLCETPKLVDLFGGVGDLRRGILRQTTVDSFPSDPLRILRAYRFSLHLGFSLESGTRESVRRYSRLLPSASGERLREELLKILSHDRSWRGIKEMWEDGVLVALFPEMHLMSFVGGGAFGGTVWEHTLCALKNYEESVKERLFQTSFGDRLREYLDGKVGAVRRDVLMKFALLWHDVGKPFTYGEVRTEDGVRLTFHEHQKWSAAIVERYCEFLRFSRQERRWVVKLVEHHMRLGFLVRNLPIPPKHLYRYFRDLGEVGIALLFHSVADVEAHSLSEERVRERREQILRGIEEVLEAYYSNNSVVLKVPKVVDGHDIKRWFGVRGPIIRELLEFVRELYVEGAVRTKEEARKYLESYLKERKGS